MSFRRGCTICMAARLVNKVMQMAGRRCYVAWIVDHQLCMQSALRTDCADFRGGSSALSLFRWDDEGLVGLRDVHVIASGR